MGREETRMNFKVIVCIALPILNVVLGITLNFFEFLSGSPTTLKNLTVTSVYFAFWIISMVIAYETENKALMRFYTVIWILTLGFAGLTAFINYTDTTADFSWAIPFVALLLPQWVGIDFIVDSFFATSIIIMVISLTFLISTTSILRRWKKSYS